MSIWIDTELWVGVSQPRSVEEAFWADGGEAQKLWCRKQGLEQKFIAIKEVGDRSGWGLKVRLVSEARTITATSFYYLFLLCPLLLYYILIFCEYYSLSE